MWKVYSLADPRDGRIRYIGCTGRKTLQDRLGNHLRDARNSKSAGYETKRNQWIREVVEAGHRPLIQLIHESETQEEGWELERYYIAQLRDQLVNEYAGGPGGSDPSPEYLQRYSKVQSRVQKEVWAKDDGTRRAFMREVALSHPENIKKAQQASAAKRTGKPLPPEWAANVAAAQRRPEVNAKRSAALKGRKRSEETKRKMSEAQRRRWAEGRKWKNDQ